MADDVTVDNNTLTDYLVSADEVVATGALLQRVKLAYSADGVATHVMADANGLLTNMGSAVDSFGHIITGELNNDVDVQFYRATSDSDLSNIITETEANGGTASKSNGMATFASTATASSRAKGVSLVKVAYTAATEVYMFFSAAFPTATGGTSSYRRIGLYNDLTDGFFIGYETTGTFGITVLKGGALTTTLKASFSADTLVGGAGSLFTRAGTPEAIDLTKLNVFRIRFGWLGSAPIEFEVLAPDGNWVVFHKILQPNLSALPSINTADLYVTCDVATGTSGNAQSILTNCWGAGTTQKLRKLTDTLTDNTLAAVERAVITGVTTGGGGGYVNVKVNPSGALTADVTGTVTVAGGAAHDAAISGNPVRLAGRALTADYTAVATGDTADLITSVLGKQVTLPYALPGAAWKYAAATSGITDTTAVTIKAAGGGAAKNYLTHLSVTNGHASVSTEVAIRDGAGGTVLWRGWAQAVGSTREETFVPPLVSTANTLLEVVCITTGSAVYVNAQGYSGAE